jgi:hypothetical protein
MGVLKNNPDVSTAAHNGAPTMTPASESGDETIGFSLQPNAGSATTSTIGNSATVETVTPGSPNSIAPAGSAATDAGQPAASGTSSDSSTTQSANTNTTAPPADSSQESSSKKKSKLRKVIPF